VRLKVLKELGAYPVVEDAVLFSATKRTGLETATDILTRWLVGHDQDAETP